MCDCKNDKLLILGLDGATWDVLTPAIAKGWMPFLEELKAKGSYGNLESTFPYMTAPAWVSFYTGTDPRTHKVFDWGVRNRDYHFNLINSTYIKNTKLWGILNQNGKRVAVINLPTTYPPEQLDGVMVTGMFTPGTHAEYTFPAELKDQIKNEFPHYRIDLRKSDFRNRKNRTEEFVRNLIKMVRDKKLLAQWINRNNDLDALILVFVEMDRLQHCLFAELKDCLDGRDHSYQVLFRDFFIELDTAIRVLYQDFKPTHFFSLSDHGFTKFAKRFSVNTWLRDQGHLSIRRRFKLLSGIKSILSRVNIDKSTIRKWLSGYKSSKLKNINLPFNVFRQSVNWSATKAFMVGSVGICLNIKGRDKKGILTCEQAGFLADQICQQLTELRVDGEKLFSRIYLKSQYVAKDYGCNIPDILLKPNNGIVISSRLEGAKEMFQTSQGWDSGTHDTKGIFLAVGETIKTDFQVQQISIVDVLPTIIYLMGLPIPNNVDGIIRQDIAQEKFVGKQAVVFREYAPGTQNQIAWEDKGEEDQIKKRLQELGYL